MESTNENEATEILNRLVEQYQTPLRRMCFIMLRDEEQRKTPFKIPFSRYTKISTYSEANAAKRHG